MKRYIKSAIVPISDEDSNIRKEIAKSTSGDDLTVDQLSSDKDRKVREQLAKNPNTPIDTLRKLSTDKSYKVRTAVAKNPNTPSELLAEMSENAKEWAEHTHFYDLYGTYPITALFKNLKTPIEWRIKLLQSNRLTWDAIASVARGKKNPPELLSAIANYAFLHNVSEVLTDIRKNPNTPPDILRKIYNKSAWSSGDLIRNPNTPADVLKKILKDSFSDNETRALVLKHPNLPADVRAQYSTQVAEEKKKNSLRPYIGKDIWLAGESYGISRDFPCYYRLVSVVDSKKKIYEVNLLYEKLNWNDPIERAMNETENYQLDDDSDDSNGKIYRPFESYTTEELLAKLYPTYDEE